MVFKLSQKALNKHSNEKIVQWPNHEIISKYVTNGAPNPLKLEAIFTAPYGECYMNFVLNTEDKTN